MHVLHCLTDETLDGTNGSTVHQQHLLRFLRHSPGSPGGLRVSLRGHQYPSESTVYIKNTARKGARVSA
jgi:hypothetical protein